ncbi:sulfur reduction protein DsrE [Candidatus Roizmanbacteria bacterium RIFCSPLOWO2_01_FULL_37_12]|uniref:Sulfur reduction protein DsrE n=1 Tax=Candidatus Roizmanbacteria bacterium RIFCSPLOWO2_01_FULL_37_12 TaxID=1802056 RepID=A0A1F7IAX5_9BACT|nr:MAG: sulfur reduction protein DsrE [Candidatus Roizmanbacteria bacterium RIFCSPHIGHO2_01_FULL_37_16]OGK25778.1 MAG: sulfur reduction protein DsrE [Candidatus Roizmanbacteria bacterium RIFCSPHIGHO2_02_FULL_37_9b]OGK40480.1 MAG: sulfur reduction protein DsrE [Candidatus Roizmanbacteria bacterium RIFCSPLOWO2_01_FULL_37_12]
MKLTVILSTKNAETNWNALRLANLALKKGDEVSIFLLGDGVEYDKYGTEKFNIREQIDSFLQADRAKIIACGTCMKLRQQQSTKICPMGQLEDFYSLIVESDKVVTF